MRSSLSSDEARRCVLAAQGFSGQASEARPGDALRLLRRLGVVQLDSVNVLSRAHYLPFFARLGSYDRASLDDVVWRPRSRARRGVFEYWAHEASLLPVETQPLLRWRMALAEQHAWGRMRRIVQEQPDLVDRVLEQVREHGPVSAREIEQGRQRRAGPWWDWSEAKTALEWLFWSGQVTAATRRAFERRYDVPGRVLPDAVLHAPTPEPADAQRKLIDIAARATGVATEADLRDYFRLPLDAARTAVATLVEAGLLLPVQVQGWTQQAYLHRDAKIPRQVEARALLSPFDNLIWSRPRTERLFDFRYRVEIYVPQPKRVHGYYVLPFLLGERLVARVDLKADRHTGVLRVQAAHAEPGSPPETAVHLSAHLDGMAAWLGLGDVVIADRGDLAPALAAQRR